MASIGIDFGTAFSCAAISRDGKVEVIMNSQGSRLMPSCVAFNDIERMIGWNARNQITINPTNTIVDAKRLICEQYTRRVKDQKLYPFEIMVQDETISVKPEYKRECKFLDVTEILAMILQRIRENAEEHSDSQVTKAVISVPACFSLAHRRAIHNAALVSGFESVHLINDTSAAAIAYGARKEINPGNRIIIDFGAGKLDISVVRMDKGKYEVLSYAGHPCLGGRDIDEKLVMYALDRFQSEHDQNLVHDNKAMSRIRKESEHIKEVLSLNNLAS